METEIEFHVENFIYASSSEVYQTPNNIPTYEEEICKVPDVKNPRYSYGASKLIGEIRVTCNIRIAELVHDLDGNITEWSLPHSALTSAANTSTSYAIMVCYNHITVRSDIEHGSYLNVS